jgi:hypothetical protein
MSLRVCSSPTFPSRIADPIAEQLRDRERAGEIGADEGP